MQKWFLSMLVVILVIFISYRINREMTTTVECQVFVDNKRFLSEGRIHKIEEGSIKFTRKATGRVLMVSGKEISYDCRRINND